MFNGAVTIVETSWGHYDICMLACVFEFARPTKTPARLFRFRSFVACVIVCILFARSHFKVKSKRTNFMHNLTFRMA